MEQSRTSRFARRDRHFSLFTGSGETFTCDCSRKLNRDQRFHLTLKWTKTANQCNKRVLTQSCSTVVAYYGGSVQFFRVKYLPSLSINYVAMKQRFGKITITVVLDKDENLL